MLVPAESLKEVPLDLLVPVPVLWLWFQPSFTLLPMLWEELVDSETP